jgi:circadian clock protein KaiC
MQQTQQNQNLVPTGIPGLDATLRGGLPKNRVYLLEGDPGVGKTTLALQFLLEGKKRGEKVLLVSLAETPDELSSVSDSHGWQLEGIDVLNLAPSQYGQEEEYSILQPSEIELSDTIKKIIAEVDRIKPTRVVLDSLSEIRLLAQNPLRYRRQILALKQNFSGKATVLLLDDRTSEGHDLTLQSLVHGVIELQKFSPTFGKARRKLQVVKLRGVSFQAGFHDFNIEKGGLEVYPRLVAADYQKPHKKERCPTGVKALDDLIGGGLDRGTTCLIMGPAGTGKSSLCALHAVTAAERGDKVVIFTFDEGTETLLDRAAALKMDLRPHIKKSNIRLQQIDPTEMSPGEFMWHVRNTVEVFGAQMVIIDSLTGYLDAMPESQFLTIQMHEMLTYLNQQGILTILTMAQHGFVGGAMNTPADISYLADTVLLTRYFESEGAIHKAISVIKKRSGKHEKTIREYELGPDRIEVGPALKDFQGVLTGVPVFKGSSDEMLNKEKNELR